ncbi:alanine acetyltransferase [Stenotrophomonas humi]|uniref:Alanine acetyltransferase n=1 Tax=Stenotrophomonas humi TaxID=405444 RepID=A0A0R0CAT0_9GAMM|nr:hypothetical protein [Stenotrophomonas humi]KRG66320.1 alanine acetyltransferase [Stenotrophomonas humi]
MWSTQQQAWLQAMGYTVYLEGSALDALASAEAAMPAPVAVEIEPMAAPAPRAAPPPRREAPQASAPETPVTAASRPLSNAGRRAGGLRMPDRLQIALLRASGCNPNDPQTRVLMDSWPLAELRADPAAKRALWPQLRALRRKQRP